MTTSHAGHHTGSIGQRRWPAVVQRWPTLLAVAATVVLAGDRDEGAVGGLAAVLALLPAFYAVMLAVGRRRWTWPLMLLGLVGVVALRVADVVDLPTTLIVVGVVGLGAALLHGRRPREVVVQGVGLALFGGAALTAGLVAPDVALWVVAAGWLGHGLWDLWHLRRDVVVSRSFAEWCGVVDVLVAVQLVAASFTL